MKSEFNQDELSPLARSIYGAFESAKARGDSALLVFWESWGENLSFRGVAPGQNPWSVYNDMVRRQAFTNLCYAFDLKKPFTAQYDVKTYGQIETMQAFATSPVVWIPDRSGRVPAQARQDFLRAVTKPRFTAIVNDRPRRTGPEDETAKEKGATPRPSFTIIR